MIKELLYKWFGVEEPPCESCETLKMQLSIANHEKQEMLNTILSLAKPSEGNGAAPTVDYEKLKPRMMSWNVRRQMLEAEDRKTAQVQAEQRKAATEATGAPKEPVIDNPRLQSIKDLEAELGIEDKVDA